MKLTAQTMQTEKTLAYRVTRKYEGKTSAQALVLNLIRAHAG